MQPTHLTLDAVYKVLIRTFWIGLGLHVVWGLWYFTLGGLSRSLSESLFGLTGHEFDLFLFGWIALWKLGVIGVLVLCIAVRWALNAEVGSPAETIGGAS